MSSASNLRLSILDALRGVAAMMVCWFHFTYAIPEFALPDVVRLSGKFGWLGVYIFFVISGVALPQSMLRSGYQPRDYWRLLAKRILRIEPPYMATLALMLAIAWVSIRYAPHRAGEPFPYSTKQILLHLGYVNTVFGEPWLSKVFWTLAVEFQYYLALGVLFPLFVSRRRTVLVSSLLLFALTPFVARHTWFVAHYTSIFMMGLGTFAYRNGFLDRKTYLLVLLVLGTITGLALEWIVAATAVATSLLIACVPFGSWRPLILLGAISYPLYLLHLPVGTGFITLAMRYVRRTDLNPLILAGAISVTLAASIAMHLAIERPAQRWASAIRYRHTLRPESSLEETHDGGSNGGR